MRSRAFDVTAALLLALAVIAAVEKERSPDAWSPAIPRVWDEDSLRTLDVPLADSAASPRYVSADYYYRMPVHPIYKTYPIYRPDREPPGYFESLRKKKPEVLFDPRSLKTKADWIRAGQAVFEAPIDFDDGTFFAEVRDPAWYSANGVPTTKEGVLPFFRYVVREKGKVELGFLACASCHTRVMPDGSAIEGAQGNFPDDRTYGYEHQVEAARTGSSEAPLRDFRKFMRRAYAAPWIAGDPNARPDTMSFEAIVTALESIQPGTCARQGTSLFFPARIPSLIGVKDRRYLDSSGHVQHRSIGDLMRYAAINQGMDYLSLYGTFRPRDPLPDPATEERYSDQQLYALALYVYSLEPPPNPNPFDDLAARGQRVFESEGCKRCHTPPLYTNNRLIAANGFEVPKSHRDRYDVSRQPVGTDPSLTLQTRRGTGYYKVPSLKGVWYRGPFEHNGSVATLEDWFDPHRLDDDYSPTGFKRFGKAHQAVPGHPFGLDLPADDRRALIAFLKTL